MSYAAVEKHCMGLPGVTRDQPFGDSHVFKVGGKMFAMIPMTGKKPSGVWFKAGETSMRILVEIDGIYPCPYLARAKWVAMDDLKPLTLGELKQYLTRAHAIVASGLPKKKREALGIASAMMEDNPFL